MVTTVIISNTSVDTGILTTTDSPGLPNGLPLSSLAILDRTLYVYTNYVGTPSWYPILNDANFCLSTQVEPKLVWTVNHNLNSNNLWMSIFNGDGIKLVPDNVVHNWNNNTTEVYFNTPVSGKVLFVQQDTIDVYAINKNITIEDVGIIIDSRGIKVDGIRILTTFNTPGIVDAAFVTQMIDGFKNELFISLNNYVGNVTKTNKSGEKGKIGTFVYLKDEEGFDLAKANSLNSKEFIGILISEPENNTPGLIQTLGPITLTNSQWSQVTDSASNLIPKEKYYLSHLSNKITTNPPDGIPGTFICLVGTAITHNTLLITKKPSIGF